MIYAEPEWGESKWIKASEFNSRIHRIAKENEKKIENPYVHELQAPKANFMSDVGEICIIPVQTYIRLDDEDDSETSEQHYVVGMRIDHLFVRDIKLGSWSVFEFNRDILDQDFDALFPNFPVHLKNQLDDGVIEAQAEEAEAEAEELD